MCGVSLSPKVAIYSTWYMGMGDHHVRSMAFINLFHGISSGGSDVKSVRILLCSTCLE